MKTEYSLLFGFMLVLLAGCSTSPPSSTRERQAVPIHVAEVDERLFPTTIEALGVLKPAASVDVRPLVSGMITQIAFEEGQSVQKGDLLFTIDDRSYLLQLQSAEAILLQHQANVEALSKKWQRYESLMEKNLVPRQEWEELNAELASAQAQLKIDAANRGRASLDLAHCQVCAPISGLTSLAQQPVGCLVAGGQSQPLVTVASIDELLVDFTITEKESQKLWAVDSKKQLEKTARLFNVRSCLDANVNARGKLAFAHYGFDPTSGRLQLRGVINNRGLNFLAYQNVKVEIPLEEGEPLKSIPLHAVKINQKGHYVYRLTKAGQVELRQVALGEERGDRVVVISGLEVGDEVVVTGHLRLYDGVKVEVVRPLAGA